MSRNRLLAWLIAAFSLVTMIVALRALIAHAESYNARSSRPVFAFELIDEAEFTYADRPVTFTPGEPTADGVGTVLATYGDVKLSLRDTIPGTAELPGLLPYENWLRVLRFVDATGVTQEEAMRRLDAGEDRLVIVTRTLNPGVDPRTWGSVWKSDWRFEFHEFLPAGGFETSRKRFPESERSLKRRQASAKRAGEPIPDRSPDDLSPEDWRYDAALQVMPPGQGPKMVFDADALSGAGWAWPGAVFSALALIVSIGFAAAPRKTTSPAASETRPATKSESG